MKDESSIPKLINYLYLVYHGIWVGRSLSLSIGLASDIALQGRAAVPGWHVCIGWSGEKGPKKIGFEKMR